MLIKTPSQPYTHYKDLPHLPIPDIYDPSNATPEDLIQQLLHDYQSLHITYMWEEIEHKEKTKRLYIYIAILIACNVVLLFV